MAVAGVDIGAVAAKAVVLEDNQIRGYAIAPTGYDVATAAKKVLQASLKKAGLVEKDLERIVATGYGRISVSFADEKITEISCHAKGATWLAPETRMVIDIGGQDSKAIKIDENGAVTAFAMNDKCAAGTGRFLEVMARALELPIAKFGKVSLNSASPCNISSTCTVFAETEVISLRAEKKPIEDIIAGIHRAVAKRVVAMMTSMNIVGPIAMTGGVAKNVGQRKALEEELGSQLIILKEPQIVGALGAALLARR